MANRISASYRKLKELEITLSKTSKSLLSLHALPAAFEATVTSIVQKDKSEWNFESIKVNLIEAQQRIRKYEQREASEIAMKVHGKVKCIYCKKNNHTSAKCWFNPNRQNNSANIADTYWIIISKNVVEPGFEPRTSCFLVRCSTTELFLLF